VTEHEEAGMNVRWMERWRQTAADRGFRQDGGGWITPGGQRMPAEFVRAVCSEVVEPCRGESERRVVA
jgi:hypothetical protein